MQLSIAWIQKQQLHPTNVLYLHGLRFALEPQACGGSVTRQSRRQFSRDIFLSCLSDQSNIACLMIIRGVLHPIFHSFLFFCIFFTVNITILGDMIERLDVTHLL